MSVKNRLNPSDHDEDFFALHGTSETRKRRRALSWSLAGVLIVALIADGLWFLIPWWKNRGLSIIPTEQWGIVENGSVFDKAMFDLGEVKTIVLPDNAVVSRKNASGTGQLFLKKRLSFYGHPPKPISLRGVRKKMGCAILMEGEALVMATFGEWEGKEGGATMKVIVLVPENVTIEQRSGLSGSNSLAHRKDTFNWESIDEEYWYAPPFLAKGWSAIPDMPDGDRIAE